MNSTSAQPIPVSNPSTVIQMIESRCDDAGLDRLLSPTPRPVAVPSQHRLRLHIDPDEQPQPSEPLDLSEPPTRQVEQLIDHLHRRQSELSQREADLQAQMCNWEQETLAKTARLRKRSSELEQQLSQVRLQQEQLIKLQQNLIDGQQAIRMVVERIVDECQPADLKRELVALKQELNHRFDSIFHCWQQLKPVDARR